MNDLSLAEEMEELSSAEDFLDYFGITYEQKIVSVNRLHILQRFHDYIAKGQQILPSEDNEAAQFEIYKQLLTRAYTDFVESDAVTEKVFKVFHMHEPQTSFVPLDQVLQA